MINKDFTSFEKLFDALQSEAGRNLLETDRKFKSEFFRLKTLLDKVYKVSAVPREAFGLANQLLLQIDNSLKEYGDFQKRIDGRCDAVSSEYPALFSRLKVLARTDRKAVETILNELTD